MEGRRLSHNERSRTNGGEAAALHAHDSMSAVPAQFDGKQFSKDEVSEKVVEQYDDKLTRIFYQCVMGGGGHDIHFGIYRDEDYGVKEAAAATTEFMLLNMDWAKKVRPTDRVLDLGSGHGGGTHAIVQKFGCHVSGINLGPQQNEMNLERCKELGIADKVDVRVGNINDGLPEEWESSFDYVFSCEVLCHAAVKEDVFKEIYRVLKPGGVLVFTDIMGSDEASEEALRPFTDRNATTYMGRPSKYIQAIKGAGLKHLCFWDQSEHLETFFRGMYKQTVDNKETMLKAGLTEKYLQSWEKSLSERAEIQSKESVFAWGVFVAKKMA